MLKRALPKKKRRNLHGGTHSETTIFRAMAALLAVKDLVKQFPGVRAVDGISFAIAEGSCFGLLGPNGAGKTTTLEMMEGLTRPTAGEVLYKGGPLGRAFKSEAGIQFQSTVLQDFLTTREVLQLFASFYPRTIPIAELTEMCALGEFLDRDNRKLSGGQRQRLFLALALVNDPEIVFLDEPTTGLDPHARRNTWQVIRSIKARRKTVVLTTHYMEEAHVLCDEIAIMDHGRFIAQGPPATRLREHVDMVVLDLPEGRYEPPADFPWPFAAGNEGLEIRTPDIDRTMAYLMEREVSLQGLRVRSPTLEDLFLALTGHELRA